MFNCLYVNPDSGPNWTVDFRTYEPDGDGKTKLCHVKEMLISLVARQHAVFDSVLMDSWYQIKQGSLSEYLKQELRSPSVRFSCLRKQPTRIFIKRKLNVLLRRSYLYFKKYGGFYGSCYGHAAQHGKASMDLGR